MKDQLLKECEKQIGKALSDALTSYSSPLVKAVQQSLLEVEPQLKEMASTAISDMICDSEFKEIMQREIKSKLAKVLISKIGGEIESTVNKLKSDPTSRAKITIAVDSVISELLPKN